MSSADFQLPPGFRFHPTDEDLVKHYLCRKCASQQISVPIIVEIDLYKYDPWELPGLALYGEKGWYFFSPRDRKYPNGSRPEAVTGRRPVPISRLGIRNRWGLRKLWCSMPEKPLAAKRPTGLCTSTASPTWTACRGKRTASGWMIGFCAEYTTRRAPWRSSSLGSKRKNSKRQVVSTGSEFEDGKPPAAVVPTRPPNDYVYFDTSKSVPKLHTDSSCSEHVVSPEFTCEVQGEPKWKEWEKAFEFPYNHMDATVENGFGAQFQSGN